MIISRYLTKELTKSWLAVVLVLLAIAISNKFVSIITKAATGELPVTLVFKMVALYIPEFTALLIPLALFLAILMTFGRLYVEQEMLVLSASGLGPPFIIKVVLKLALVAALLVGFLTLYAMPKINLYKEKLIAEQDFSMLIGTIAQGQFHSLKGGQLVFYVAGISSNKKEMQQVFIAEQPSKKPEQHNPWEVVMAATGKLVQPEKGGKLFLELQNGYHYRGAPGHKDYYVVEYGRYGKLLEKTSSEIPPLKRTTSTYDLWQSTDLGFKAELQWRLSMPLAALLLALLAVPLAKIEPRQGRFAKFLPAVVIFIVYYNLITVSKRWVEAQVLPPALGVWWVHLLLMMVAIVMLWRQMRFKKVKAN